LIGRLLLDVVSVVSPTNSSGATLARSPRTAREFVGTLAQRLTAYHLMLPHNTADSYMLPEAHIDHHPDTRCSPP
jgi:hypothetical protein